MVPASGIWGQAIGKLIRACAPGTSAAVVIVCFIGGIRGWGLHYVRLFPWPLNSGGKHQHSYSGSGNLSPGLNISFLCGIKPVPASRQRSSPRYTDRQEVHEKMLHVPQRQDNADQNYSRMSLPPVMMATEEIKEKKSVDKDWEQSRPLYIVGRDGKWRGRCNGDQVGVTQGPISGRTDQRHVVYIHRENHSASTGRTCCRMPQHR